MKRILTFAFVIVAFAVFTNVGVAKVVIKTPSKAASTKTETKSEQADAAASDKETDASVDAKGKDEKAAPKASEKSAKKNVKAKTDESKVKESKSDESKTSDAKSSKAKESGSKGTPSGVVETLMDPPSSPLKPMSDMERDSKYPVVPDALQMTLEILAPTKELRNIRVLKTMARIPRAEFVPKDFREYAYMDAAIPIGEGQTISPPFIVAYMTEALDPQPTDRVLEIGTGSGYQAAVLSCLVSEVYSIEIVKSLGRRAAEVLKHLQYDNTFVRIGDGYQGWPEVAPFDKIIVTCSPEEIPQPLIDQLKEGGKMLIPIGERYVQYFVLCEKKNGELVKTTLKPANFVPMTGEAESKRQVLPDPTAPSIAGGDFEEVNPTPGEVLPTATWKTDDGVSDEEKDELSIQLPAARPTPAGWFSTRNVYVAERADAFEGKRVCVFDNASVVEEHKKKERNESRVAAATLPEERASEGQTYVKERQREQEAISHMRQSFAIDGTSVKKIVISGAYRVEQLEPKVDTRNSVILMKIYFFDHDRKPVRNGGEFVVVTAEAHASDWMEFEREISVPARATEASLHVGILDGVGVVEMDALSLKNKNERSSKKR